MRIVRIVLGVVLAVALPGAALRAGFAVTMSRDFAAAPPAAASPQPRSRHAGRIPVAVLLGKNGSVGTDVLGPFDVLASSAAFDVYTVSVSVAPVALSGGLHIVPDYAVADAPTPKVVIVPALSDPSGPDEAPLRDLIERVHRTGGTVVSICSGARVLAATDVLDGRRATSFWNDIGSLRRSDPQTTWVAGTRWVEDGNVMSTAGVSSGVLGALHLVQRFAGAAEADRIGARVSYPGWSSSMIAPPPIPVHHIAAADYPYALNATLPWFQPTYGLGLTDGVDEIDVTAAAELYGGAAFTAHVVPVAAGPAATGPDATGPDATGPGATGPGATGLVVTTAHGLQLLAKPIGQAGHLDRLVVPGVERTDLLAGDTPVFLPQTAARPGDSGFDPVLRDIAASAGRPTAEAAAKYIEYPVHDLPGGTREPWRIVVLVLALLILAVGGASAPMAIRRRRRPHLDPAVQTSTVEG